MRKIILIQLTFIVTFYLICCLYPLSIVCLTDRNTSRNIIFYKFRSLALLSSCFLFFLSLSPFVC